MPPTDEQPAPPAPIAGPPRRKPRVLRIVVITVIAVIVIALSIVGYYIQTVWTGITSEVNKCAVASMAADQAQPVVASALNGLDLGNNPAVKAVTSKYGDCVDASSYVGEARSTYDESAAFTDLHASVSARLAAAGFTAGKPPALENIYNLTDAVVVAESYTGPSPQTLTIRYTVTTTSPSTCTDLHAADYSQCLDAYRALLGDFSKLTVSKMEATLKAEYFER